MNRAGLRIAPWAADSEMHDSNVPTSVLLHTRPRLHT